MKIAVAGTEGLLQYATKECLMAKTNREGGRTPTGTLKSGHLREARRDLRFKLYIDVKIQSHSMGSVLGRTLEVSERGLSATLPLELPIGEVVALSLMLRIGNVNVHATVRDRNAFRHGFQFVEPNPALHLIRENCCLLERIPNPSVRSRCKTLGLKQ